MSDTAMPGFSAEAALDVAGRSYRSAGRGEHGPVAVVPAFMCGGMCLVCAIALADPLPFDEIMACGICAGCLAGGSG